MPPVMSRVPLTGPSGAASVRRSQKARRRYDVALGYPGAEIRLPSMPQIAIGWRLVSFVLVAALGFALYQLWNAPMYRVKAAEITGLQQISSSDVNAVLGVTGQQIFTLTAGDLEDRLLTAFPEFSSVSISIGWPDKVTVNITERTPVLTWRQDGQVNLVDEAGVAFPPRLEGQETPAVVVEALTAPPEVLLPDTEHLAANIVATNPANGMDVAAVTGTGLPLPVARQLLTPEMVSGILALAVHAPQNTPLTYDQMYGLGWKDPRGWEIYFGDVTDIEMKLNIYRAIVNRLREDEVQPALISVVWVHAPYYRLER